MSNRSRKQARIEFTKWIQEIGSYREMLDSDFEAFDHLLDKYFGTDSEVNHES